MVYRAVLCVEGEGGGNYHSITTSTNYTKPLHYFTTIVFLKHLFYLTNFKVLF